MEASASAINETLRVQIGHETSANTQRQQQHNRVKTAKYTILTFIPLALFNQFCRIANLYFLFMTIITSILQGFGNSTSVFIPLVVVVLLAFLRLAREDYIRHKQDQLVNHTKVTVIRNGVQVETESQFIASGELVVIKEDTDVPCDLVLLQTTDPQGKCFVTTANLDGETNLKTLFIPRDLQSMKIDHLNTLGTIECEPSKTDLYSFKGKLVFSNGTASLGLIADNLLLRGARVKDTECVIGCAVYLGMNTKLQLNSRLTSHKRATSEWYLNIYLIIMVVFMILFVTLLYLLERYDEINLIPRMAYMGPPIDANTGYEFFVEFFSLLIIFDYMIPISFYGTSEIYRLFGVLYMRWDLRMYDEETDEPCMVRSSNLNEELGQIDILFSDKTGTLTKNIMVFKECSIRGRKYQYQKTQLLDMELNTQHEINFFNRDQRKFFEALAICHTVQVVAEKGLKSDIPTGNEANYNFSASSPIESPDVVLNVGDTLSGNVSPTRDQHQVLMRLMSEDRQQELDEIVQTLDYKASSPDEKALIEGCAHLGLVYLGDEQGTIKMRVLPPHRSNSRPYSIGETKGVSYERLHVLEFTSDRKRMSVIVRDRNGSKWIYTKGAETSIFPLCIPNSSEIVKITGQHIDEFACNGLRTLAIARKQISDKDYQSFVETLNIANNSLEDRLALINKTYSIVERDLELLGATAVEDMLQDNVIETLSSLQTAGIKVWVLTGDKVETALTIALSCGHIPSNATRHMILNCTEKEEILEHLNNVRSTLDNNHKCALLIDSTSLTVALEQIPEEFRDITIQCQAVLCCRLSPFQKSQVVALIRSCRTQYITAAIGDGANDVSMIQEAHIGIGIFGLEGRQAVMSADYSVAKFSMIKPLFLIHGHYNTARLARMICFYFYQNILLIMCMFMFQFYSMHSGTNLYDATYLGLYSTVYNGVSIVLISATEKPYSEETLLSNPELYNECRNYKPLNWPTFSLWIFSALYQSVIIFYFAYIVFSVNDVVVNVGQTGGLAVFGIIIIQCVVVVCNLKQWLELHYVTHGYIRTFVWAILIFVVTSIIHNVINIIDDPAFYWAYFNVASSIPLWLFTLVTIIACLLPDYLLRYLREGFKLQERWSFLEKSCFKRSDNFIPESAPA